jgi:glutaredoxin-related protein
MLKKLDIKFSEIKVTTKSFNEDLILRDKTDFFNFSKNKKRISYF